MILLCCKQNVIIFTFIYVCITSFSNTAETQMGIDGFLFVWHGQEGQGWVNLTTLSVSCHAALELEHHYCFSWPDVNVGQCNFSASMFFSPLFLSLSLCDFINHWLLCLFLSLYLFFKWRIMNFSLWRDHRKERTSLKCITRNNARHFVWGNDLCNIDIGSNDAMDAGPMGSEVREEEAEASLGQAVLVNTHCFPRA